MDKPVGSLLIHCRHAPYSSSLARGGIEVAMAAAVFDQPVTLLFSGDGVWQLVAEHHSEGLPDKNHGKLLSALPLYGVDQLFVDQEALQARSLTTDDLCVEVQSVHRQHVKALLADCAQVMTF